MPCNPFKYKDSVSGNIVTGMMCSRIKYNQRDYCAYCDETLINEQILCDYPVGSRLKKPQKRADGSKRWHKECNKAMCRDCAQKLYPEANFDFCRDHFPIAQKAWDAKPKDEKLAIIAKAKNQQKELIEL